MYRRLRTRCEARVRELDIPTPFDVSELCRRLERQRGRPITLLPIELPPDGPCGLWVSTDAADYIFYEARTSVQHQEHIVLHEIGHLLCEHEAAPVLGAAASGSLLPSLDPRMVQQVLGRTHYTAVEEREAELIATLILGRAHRHALDPDPIISGDTAGVLARIEQSLGRWPRRPE